MNFSTSKPSSAGARMTIEFEVGSTPSVKSGAAAVALICWINVATLAVTPVGTGIGRLPASAVN